MIAPVRGIIFIVFASIIMLSNERSWHVSTPTGPDLPSATCTTCSRCCMFEHSLKADRAMDDVQPSPSREPMTQRQDWIMGHDEARVVSPLRPCPHACHSSYAVLPPPALLLLPGLVFFH